MLMANDPIGRFDHIGIAVHSIEQSRAFFEKTLGAKMRYVSDNQSGDFRVGIFDLGNFCIELLEPVNPDGFLAKFLEKRGEGVHHITLQTPNLAEKVDAMKPTACGWSTNNSTIRSGSMPSSLRRAPTAC